VILQIGQALPTTPWQLVLASSFETKLVLVVLAVFSVATWFLIVLKWVQFRRMHRQGDRFFAEMERAGTLQEAFHAVMKQPPSPYGRMLREGMNFFTAISPNLKDPGDPAAAKRTQIEVLQMVFAKEIGAERDLMSRFIPWLATIGSTSPLLGLLGTVLGVMDAFIGISTKGSGNISAVAPGVAEALVTTVAGLAVAIPAVIAYNIFVNRLTLYAGELEGFAYEVMGTMAREGKL
jgi:biopolymer transport protein TolQ